MILPEPSKKALVAKPQKHGLTVSKRPFDFAQGDTIKTYACSGGHGQIGGAGPPKNMKSTM